MNPFPLARWIVLGAIVWTGLHGIDSLQGTPANKAAFARHFDRFLPAGLNGCETCHLPGNTEEAHSLEDLPHNAFGRRLREVRRQRLEAGIETDLASRLDQVAEEDADGDGLDNLTEILLGRFPGVVEPDGYDGPAVEARLVAYRDFRRLHAYPWKPFEPVVRPGVPLVNHPEWIGNPVDRFLAAGHEARGLTPQPEADRAVLLRRVYLDLTGLTPTPGEVREFLSDASPEAYEKVVDRLLASPQHGERWARHWMDVWRYSDWAGYKQAVRDSKPFIWRWRDWIVESLNADKGYDRMLLEMLAADELVPEDLDALRATGFLVRNYKSYSREKWLEDTVNHTFQGFLGVTIGCAKCHDHKYDPISQEDYFRVRAIFTPHLVRTDRLPGELDTAKDGLVRAYDANLTAKTYLLERGDERFPVKDQVMEPAVPSLLGGSLKTEPVELPVKAWKPDRRGYVLHDLKAAARARVETARQAVAKAAGPESELALEAALADENALLAVLAVEEIEANGEGKSAEWKERARAAFDQQRVAAHTQARLDQLRQQNLEKAAKARVEAAGDPQSAAGRKAASALAAVRKKREAADQALVKAQAALEKPVTEKYTPRKAAEYPPTSTGRRLAFARWLTERRNPLTARVAVNHVWLRHFGAPLLPSVNDFGANGTRPTHPALLDWLAVELMEHDWSLKHLHRLLVTSRAYRMAATGNAANETLDPDNLALWRMNSRRMEGEIVRDNLLHIAGQLDPALGGADIDHLQAETSHRRSLYLRHAHEKRALFLTLFDGPNVTECYRRTETILPQQALALANSRLAEEQAGILAGELLARTSERPDALTEAAFLRILGRAPSAEERRACEQFLEEQSRKLPERVASLESDGEVLQRAARNLVLVLFNHNDFVTIR